MVKNRPEGLLGRVARARSQALTHIGGQGRVLEREIRDAYGNSADVSKALRQLVGEGALRRTGEGGKRSAFAYTILPKVREGCTAERDLPYHAGHLRACTFSRGALALFTVHGG